MDNKHIPSYFANCNFFLENKIITKQMRIYTIQSSSKFCIGKTIGETNADVPKINNVLNILLPIKFPIAKLPLFFFKATIEVEISGKEVPIAIISIAMKV